MNAKKTFLLSIAVLSLSFIVYKYCSKIDDPDTKSKKSEKIKVNTSMPLNISVYLDLSDRLKRDLTPSQKERDLAIIDYLADFFKKQTLGPKILESKNNIKVFFYPTPTNSDIATMANDLCVDMSKYVGVDKRIALENMKDKFHKNLSVIYDKTIETNNWPGCDIWDFFSNKNVDVQCVRKGFRNILIVLTDGYLFDENHKVQDGNAYSYVTPSTLKDPQSSLIVKRDGLDNLEVRILEVNPIDKNHCDHLVSVLETWLEGMGVKKDNITIVSTDLPTNTETVIESFLNK